MMTSLPSSRTKRSMRRSPSTVSNGISRPSVSACAMRRKVFDLATVLRRFRTSATVGGSEPCSEASDLRRPSSGDVPSHSSSTRWRRIPAALFCDDARSFRTSARGKTVAEGTGGGSAASTIGNVASSASSAASASRRRTRVPNPSAARRSKAIGTDSPPMVSVLIVRP